MTSTFDPTKPVQTRDGRKARIVATGLVGATYPIVAIVTEEDGDEASDNYLDTGQAYLHAYPHNDDLINIPEVPAHLKGTRTWHMSLGKGYDTVRAAQAVCSFPWPSVGVTITDGKVVSTELFDETGVPL